MTLPEGFRSIEVSNPDFTPAGFTWITAHADSLGGRGDVLIYSDSPDVEDVPVVLLLHGVQGSHWAWAFSGGAHLVYEDLRRRGEIDPFVLVMPSDGLAGIGSGYLNRSCGGFEDWIFQDVLTLVGYACAPIGDASSLYLAGLSMGGYGALRLGSKYTQMVAGISAHSAITHPAEFGLFMEVSPFDDMIDPIEEANILFWMDKNAASLPPMRLDCGSADKLIDGNRAFSAALKSRGIVHEFTVSDGAHHWGYWSSALPQSLKFFDRIEGSE